MPRGGARPGAGRKPKHLNDEMSDALTPLEFLLQAMNDKTLDANTRIRAAVAAAQYVHTKTHDGGKKEEKEREAERAVSGRFAPQVVPKLAA